MPAIVLSILGFAIIGLMAPPPTTAFDPSDAQAILAGEFNISLDQPRADGAARHPVDPPHSPVPRHLRQRASSPPCWASSPSPRPWQRSSGETAGSVQTALIAIYSALATGFVSNSGNETIDSLFSRGGMASMLNTIWLVLGALSFAAVMEHAGFLERLIRPILAAARSTGRLIAAVIGTAIGLNVIAGDQYVAIVMPSRVYRAEFAKRGIAPRMLSRTVEDAGTVTSPLVPWNSCGAYMAGVLGVATVAYLPFAFFNLLSPLISLIYGFTGFHIEHVVTPRPGIAAGRGPSPQPAEGGS